MPLLHSIEKDFLKGGAMKRLICCLLLFSLMLSLVGCGGGGRSAHAMLLEFSESYGIYGILYSPEIREGDAGYIDKDFFSSIFSSEPDFETDYAVFLSSSIESVYEAALFVAMDESSRLYAQDLCRRRILFLTEMGYGENAVLIGRKNTVFYSTLPDNERAEQLWRSVKIG